MYKILRNEKISESSYLLTIKCPIVIKNAMPGQFIIVMSKEDSERIPLTIYDYNLDNGTLDLIYQFVGASTKELSENKDAVFAITGPLGKPNEICKNYEEYKGKRIVYVAGGVGIAPVYPQVKYLKEIGEKELCKTIRAVAAIGSCIQQGRNDCDRPAIIKLYCLGHHIPSGLVADRGNIISKDKINCESVPLMKAELLK